MKAVILGWMVMAGAVFGADLEFREEFADPATRTAALERLVPGTRDWYFYRALDHQTARRVAEYRAVMADWEAAARVVGGGVSSEGAEVLKRRELLLTVETDPEASVAGMIEALELRFDDSRPDARADEKLPDQLAAERIAVPAFEAEAAALPEVPAYRHYSQERLLEELGDLERFDPDKVRYFVGALERADHPAVAGLVVRSLAFTEATEFGSLRLHGMLDGRQLDAVAAGWPEVLGNARFAVLWMSRRMPGAATDFERDREAHAAHLARCRDFVMTLRPALKPLKAHVLYHHLRLQRELGNFPLEDFTAYLGLRPRDRGLLEEGQGVGMVEKLVDEADLLAATGCGVVGDDAPLIQLLAMHHLAGQATPEVLGNWVEDRTLRRWHARAKLLAGGDAGRWGAVLTPGEFLELQKEVRVGFVPGQPGELAEDAEVSLTLDLKNTPELRVRIYQLDLPGWIGREGVEPPVDLDLDGLVPHDERVLAYEHPPLVVHREVLKFPELRGAGAWVVECVSGGVASRALIRKGRLVPYLSRTGAGQVVRVFDGGGQPVVAAELALGTEIFRANEAGEIVVPDGGLTRRDGVVRHGPLAAPVRLGERKEDLRLEVGFHLDREQLVADGRASMFLRVKLSNHGHALPVERVEEATVTLVSLLAGGNTVERVVGGIEGLSEEMTVPFQVPAEMVRMQVVVRGRVVPRDGEEAVELSAEFARNLNQMLTTGVIGGVFFTRDAGGHHLEARGRNGEPLGGLALRVRLKHRDFTRMVEARLRTNAAGRIGLGALEGIERVEVDGSGVESMGFAVSEALGQVELPWLRQVAAGQEVRVPLVRPMELPVRSRLGLVEVRDGVVLRDHFERLAVENGEVVARNLPPGDFQLRLDGWRVEIRVTDGAVRGNLVVGSGRIAPLAAGAVPFVREAAVVEDRLVVRVDPAAAGTRVHLVGRYFLSPWDAGDGLRPFSPPLSGVLRPAVTGCGYLEDRRLGDEMRYILERRAAKVFPGSMLPRPGLLVRRWSREEVAASSELLRGGAEGKLQSGGSSFSRNMMGEASKAGSFEGADGGAVLDFLARPSVLRLGLEVAADGTVAVPLGDFAGCRMVEVVAANEAGSHRRVVPLAESELPLRERRLVRALDAERYQVGMRRAAVLQKDAVAEIANVIDAEWRAFTTLGEAHAFLSAVVNDGRLAVFQPLTRWPELTEDEKLAFLAENACHELHWFLARKDPEFFRQRVVPMLEEKREPGVMDEMLLGRDLERWLRPYAWGMLNAAEKALLARELPAERGRILNELEQRWEVEAPDAEQETQLFTRTLRGAELEEEDALGLADLMSAGSVGAGVAYTTEKLRRIVIPRVDFEDVTLAEALDFLRMRAAELDVTELDPSRKGLNIVMERPAGGGVAQGGLLGGGVDPASLRIRGLQLQNVPIEVVLKYLADATKMRYRVDDFAVTLMAQTEGDEPPVTRVYSAPPDFAEMLAGAEFGSDGTVDPFLEPGGSGIRNRGSIVELLKSNGIAFGDGASATLLGNGRLIVTNTESELDKIGQLLDATVAASDPGLEMEDLSDLLPPIAGDEGLVDPFAATDRKAGEGLKRWAARPSWSGGRDRTRLWRESNYDRHEGATGERFIPLNRFWVDLAAWDGAGPFLSPHFNACTTNVNEALLCLAMLDLPFAAERPETGLEGGTLRVKARDPMLLFYKDTRLTERLAADSPVLLRQTFHGLNDRFRREGGRLVENVISGGFVAGVPYAASLVVMNPSGTGRRIDVLAQIPAGSIPLAGKPATLSSSHDLAPNAVLNLDLAFYFPAAGDYPYYPLQVSEGDLVLARSAAGLLRVSGGEVPEDGASWRVLARDGSDEAVLQRMASAPMSQLDFALIRWRLRDEGFYKSAAEILRKRLGFSRDVLSFGFLHRSEAEMRDYLETSGWRESVGSWLDSPLLKIRPQEHLGWETLEFDPLVNARAHALADQPRLRHAAAAEHLDRLLEILSWKAELSADDHLALAVQLLLQDRIGEALERFDRIEVDGIRAKMAYDYLQAVVGFHRGRAEEAMEIAKRRLEGSSGVWRERFAAVIGQAEEIARLREPRVAEPEQKAEAAPSIELALAADGALEVRHRRVGRVTLKFYQVDLEVMVSKDPFPEGGGASLPGIRPNGVMEVELDAAAEVTRVALPEGLREGSLLVAAEGGGVRALRVLDSRSIEIVRRPLERTLQVFDAVARTPLPGTYVKVFVEDREGAVRFHKDGYTDLRGMFDYGSHTGEEERDFRRVSLFISHPEKGSALEVVDG